MVDSTWTVSDQEDTYPSPSPDGTLIAFQSNRAGSSDIWLMATDGRDLRRVTDHPALDETPVWSPDGRWILFASERDGELEIFRVHPDGTGLSNVSRNPAFDDDHPKVSPDGRRIVFNSKRHDGQTYQIWVMDFDGSNPRRLTFHPEWDSYPSFSPDGRRILFRRVLPADGPDGRRNSEVFVIDADGSNPVNLSRHPAFDGYPEWSPDGGRVVFVSNRGGQERLWLVNADGTDVHPFGPAEAGVVYARPSWSADGGTIVATREQNGVTSVVMLRVRSGGASRVLFTRIHGHPATVDGGLSRGAAWGDVDGDGDADLLVANAAGQLQHLYRNDDTAGFSQLHEEPVVQDGGNSEGVSLADFDGDGDLDALVTNQFDQPLRLYRNLGSETPEGGPRFARAEAGELGTATLYSATSACWADYDLDGHLDVVVVNRDGRDDLLFHNQGDGTFRLVDDPVSRSGGDGRACAWGDVDGDGDPDLYVGNFRSGTGTHPNYLFLNIGGRFRRVTEGPVVTDRGATYGVTFVDPDEDGDLDLFVTNIGRDDHNALYLNDGTGHFHELVGDPIAGRGRPSKGHTWGDFDLDGDLDVAVVNGTESNVDLRNYLYLNDGAGRFRPVEGGDFVARPDTSASVTWADPDLDGDLDLYVTNWGWNDQDNAFFRNEVTGRHWLEVTLQGTRSNRMGLGARVRVHARINGAVRRQSRWLFLATGYASQNEPMLHFGLGDAEVVDRLEVSWPSGEVDVLEGLRPDRRLHVREGQSRR